MIPPIVLEFNILQHENYVCGPELSAGSSVPCFMFLSPPSQHVVILQLVVTQSPPHQEVIRDKNIGGVRQGSREEHDMWTCQNILLNSSILFAIMRALCPNPSQLCHSSFSLWFLQAMYRRLWIRDVLHRRSKWSTLALLCPTYPRGCTRCGKEKGCKGKCPAKCYLPA